MASFILLYFFFFLLCIILADLPTQLDVSRCTHCGKLFRGPRSSISLQEHITNIHAAVAPISSAGKYSKATSPSSAMPSIRPSFTISGNGDLANDSGGSGEGVNDDTQSCTKCSITFETREDFERHQLLHANKSAHVCNITEFKFILLN